MTDIIAPPEPPMPQQAGAQLAAKMAVIPPDKKGALIIGVDWKGGVPVWGRFGVATRVGEHLQLSVDAETKFKKAPPNAGVYAAWTW